MKTRKLIDNRQVAELEKPVYLKIYTKCPEKWKLIDLETGEQYQGNNKTNNKDYDWKRIK